MSGFTFSGYFGLKWLGRDDIHENKHSRVLEVEVGQNGWAGGLHFLPRPALCRHCCFFRPTTVLKAGAAKDSQDKDGETPLHCPAERAMPTAWTCCSRPAFSSSSTQSAWPSRAAKWSGVQQQWSFASLSVPALGDL